MQPSSLVFLAIIVAWAAYLLPQWIRRRDAMGQSPGRDRDSGGLRVLRPRRRPSRARSTVPLLGSRGAPDGGELDAVIRSDSSQTARQAAARRAAAGHPEAGFPEAGCPAIESGGGSAGSVVGGSAGSAVGGSAGSVVGGSAGSAVGGAAGPPVGVVAGGTSPPGDRRRPERVPVTPRGRVAAGRAAAIRRVRVLAVLLLLTLVSWLAAAGSLLHPVVPVTVSALLIADVIVLRTVARRRRALLRQQARSTHPAGRTKEAPSSGAGGQTGAVGDLPAERSATTGARRPATRASRASLRRTLPPAYVARRAALRRPAGHEGPAAETDCPTTSEASEASEAEAPTSDGTWMPVPVPPPTYTLKPMAVRPEPPTLELDGDRSTGSTGPGCGAAGVGGPGARVPGSDGTSPSMPPTGPAPDHSEGAEPPAAQERPALRPWEEDREWADEIDLDAVLARRRAVNG